MTSPESIRVDTKLLQTFRTVVDCRSFTAASKLLGLSQPTVSQQIQALEQDLGVALLVRSSRVVRLTPAGELVLQCAQQVLENLDRLRRLVNDHEHSGVGKLIVAILRSVYDPISAALMAQVAAELPTVQMTVLSATAAEAPEWLAAKQLDFALMPSPVGGKRLSTVEVGREEIVAVMAPSHPLAQRERLAAEDLREERLILPAAGSGEYPAWESFMIEAGVFPRVAVEAESVALAKSLAQQGVGVALAPLWTVRQEISAGTLAAVGFGRVGLWRDWCLALSESMNIQGNARVFMRICREYLPPLFAGRASRGTRQLASTGVSEDVARDKGIGPEEVATDK